MTNYRQPGIRLSFAPLEAALVHVDTERLDERLKRAIRKGRMNGYVTLDFADEIAVKVLLVHPLVVWGEEYASKVWFDMDDDPEPIAVSVVNIKRSRAAGREVRENTFQLVAA